MRPNTVENADEWFWSRVDRSGGPDTCWPWQGPPDKNGYGRTRMRMKFIHTHRIAFLLEHGRLPTPMGLHTCDNPPCCNPAHIVEGTPLENMQHKMERGRYRGAPLKLDCDKVREIRSLYPAATGRVIAERMGVSHSLIKAVLRGECWNHC